MTRRGVIRMTAFHSFGGVLFLGGIAGTLLFSIAGFAAWRVLGKQGRKLLREIQSEYQ